MSNEGDYSESGSPIYRHRARTKPFDLAVGSDETISAVSKHIEQHVGTPKRVFHELISDLVHVDVHIVEPTPARNFYALITSGMSDRPMNVPSPAEMEELKYAELMIALPPTWDLSLDKFVKGGPLEDERNYWPIRWLKTIARLPHEYDTWVGFGHTIPNGDPPAPYAPNTKLCCLMVLPPILLDQAFWELKLADRTVNFYALLPLYREEMDFKLKKGAEALLDRFDKIGPPETTAIVHPQRPSACAKRFWLF